MDQIRSGDIAVIGSEDFADYRTRLLSWAECEKLLPDCCAKVGLAPTREGFVICARKRHSLPSAQAQISLLHPVSLFRTFTFLGRGASADFGSCRPVGLFDQITIKLSRAALQSGPHADELLQIGA